MLGIKSQREKGYPYVQELQPIFNYGNINRAAKDLKYVYDVDAIKKY